MRYKSILLIMSILFLAGVAFPQSTAVSTSKGVAFVQNYTASGWVPVNNAFVQICHIYQTQPPIPVYVPCQYQGYTNSSGLLRLNLPPGKYWEVIEMVDVPPNTSYIGGCVVTGQLWITQGKTFSVNVGLACS